MPPEIFFITGLGRSGTQWLHRLLQQAPNLEVRHEWWGFRYQMLSHMHRYVVGETGAGSKGERSIWSRLCATDFIIRRCKKPVYGEVNSKVRYYLPHLIERFSPIFTYQLIRSGRSVVRSYHPRQTYTGHDLHPPLEPAPDDPLREQWHTLDRFQKLCWLWGFTTRWVDEHTNDFIRFEDLLSDYGWDLLYTKLLVPMGIELDRSAWENLRPVRVDAHHHKFTLPHWTDWSTDQTDWFDQQCGEMMRRFGYG